MSTMFRASVQSLFILFSASFLWKPCDVTYYSPHTQNRMKEKLFHMEMDLVKDVIMKIKAVRPYRDMYYKSIVYQVGQVVFKVQDQLNKMMSIYANTHHNITVPTGWWLLTHNNVRAFIEVERIGMEIHTFIDIIEEWDVWGADKEDVHPRMAYPRFRARDGDTKKKGLRTSDSEKKKKKKPVWRYGRENGFAAWMNHSKIQ